MSREPAEPARLTRAQVREVDRLAIEEYHIPGVVLMENAARAVTDAALSLMTDFRVGQALILCGGGNNGGDGLAVARHLHNRGVAVTIALTVDPARYKGDALINWQIARAMKLPCTNATPELIGDADGLIIDAIFGTGLSEPPRDPFPAIVRAIADCECPVLAVDLPSGLDCDTGVPLNPAATVVADHTVTFVTEKAGFANPASRQFTGEITIGDIGCPRELIDRVRGT